MANNKIKSKKAIVKQTHCTSYGVGNRMKLKNFDVPQELCRVLKNNLIEHPGDSQLCKDYIRLINNLPYVKEIQPEYYAVLFKILLYMECYKQKQIKSRFDLKNQALKQYNDSILITVPALDEDNPLINIGDRVKLKTMNSKHACLCTIVNIMGKDIVMKPLDSNNDPVFFNETYNVCFSYFNWPMKCLHYALNITFQRNLINLLYPKISTTNFSLPQNELDWVNKSLLNNLEQKQAVINVVHNSAYPVPYILFGPPGTGKTLTLIEMICQIRKTYKSKNILVCTSSNAAADEITKRLLALIPLKDIFRMYATSKAWKDVPKDILPISNFIDNMTLPLPKDIFILKKIVITTLVTCTRVANFNLRHDHFSYIIIDEGSQSMELESLIPITLSSAGNKVNHGMIHAQIVIAGDPYQLGPVVHCRKAEPLLAKSLLERLMECEPYKKIGSSEYNSRYITKLVRNYRSQGPILHISNKFFYDNELLCMRNKSDTNKRALNWSELSNNKFPLLFCEVKGEEIRSESLSVYNKEEIAVVIHCVKKLMNVKRRKQKIRQEDIGIITPFKLQKIMIHERLSELNLNNIKVGTVEIYQGQEKEIIILSTVRSKVYNHDGKEHIGHLSNPKRFNVAVTRAKNLLIVIGNPSVLCKDKYWKALWEYCDENNACMSVQK